MCSNSDLWTSEHNLSWILSAAVVTMSATLGELKSHDHAA